MREARGQHVRRRGCGGPGGMGFSVLSARSGREGILLSRDLNTRENTARRRGSTIDSVKLLVVRVVDVDRCRWGCIEVVCSRRVA